MNMTLISYKKGPVPLHMKVYTDDDPDEYPLSSA